MKFEVYIHMSQHIKDQSLRLMRSWQSFLSQGEVQKNEFIIQGPLSMETTAIKTAKLNFLTQLYVITLSLYSTFVCYILLYITNVIFWGDALVFTDLQCSCVCLFLILLLLCGQSLELCSSCKSTQIIGLNLVPERWTFVAPK